MHRTIACPANIEDFPRPNEFLADDFSKSPLKRERDEEEATGWKNERHGASTSARRRGKQKVGVFRRENRSDNPMTSSQSFIIAWSSDENLSINEMNDRENYTNSFLRVLPSLLLRSER